MRDGIMFPVEKPAILNILARGIHGLPVANQAGSMLNLLNEETLTKMAENFWVKTWSKFITFGTACAGVIGILLIFHLLKTAIDVVIRGYTLYTLFGWSLHLLGALSSSIGQCLMLTSSYKNPPDKTQNTSETAKAHRG